MRIAHWIQPVDFKVRERIFCGIYRNNYDSTLTIKVGEELSLKRNFGAQIYKNFRAKF